MDYKRIRANIEIIVKDQIWLHAESYTASDVSEKIDQIMDLIKEEAK